MKKSKLLVSPIFLSLLLASCGTSRGDVTLWTGFGSAYSSQVQELLDTVKEKTGIEVFHESQGSYDKLQTNMTNSIATGTYPDIANGYPDHFAGYINSDIQLPLDEYIEEYDKKNGGNLLDDYYDAYLVENQTLVANHTMGLPFNKSTELICYNVDLFDYIKSVDSQVTALPSTWDDLRADGLRYLAALNPLFKPSADGAEKGKVLFGVRGNDGHISQFEVVDGGDNVTSTLTNAVKIVDYSNITAAEFNVLMWDATDNMFITILRQWGSEYTSAENYRRGYAEFWTTANKAKTKEALQFFYDLADLSYGQFDSSVFGVTDGYNSDAFKLGEVLFTVGSSGGLSYNLPTTNSFKVGVMPILYKDASHKYVISQGTNLALFDSGNTERISTSFDVLVELTSGEIQGAWAAATGYYPASKSATNSNAYQALINNTQTSPLRVLYQDSAKLNQNTYMSADASWVKFVDPGFIGSSSIRSEVKSTVSIVLKGKSDVHSGNKTVDQVIEDTMTDLLSRIKNYVH